MKRAILDVPAEMLPQMLPFFQSPWPHRIVGSTDALPGMHNTVAFIIDSEFLPDECAKLTLRVQATVNTQDGKVSVAFRAP